MDDPCSNLMVTGWKASGEAVGLEYDQSRGQTTDVGATGGNTWGINMQESKYVLGVGWLAGALLFAACAQTTPPPTAAPARTAAAPVPSLKATAAEARSTTMPALTPILAVTATMRPTTAATASPRGPTPTRTPALPPAYVLQYRPIDIGLHLPDNASLPGSLVLGNNQKTYLWDLTQQTTQDLRGSPSCLSTSPDGRWLISCKLSERFQSGVELMVTSFDQQQTRRWAFGSSWTWDFGVTWLDDNQLQFNVKQAHSSTTGTYDAGIVNVATGARQVIASDYPNLIQAAVGQPGTPQFIRRSVIYHPSLNWVVYPQTVSDSYYVVLWDRRTKAVVARVADLDPFYNLPLWSPDGEHVAVPVLHQKGKQLDQYAYEWFSMTTGGQVEQLTHFEDYFTRVQVGLGSWSPDGRLLAFWLDAEPSSCEGQTLAVLTMATRLVTDYCILGSDTLAALAVEPIWSPDSRYIAISSIQNNGVNAIIVDPSQLWAARIGENAFAAGWLLSSP